MDKVKSIFLLKLFSVVKILSQWITVIIVLYLHANTYVFACRYNTINQYKTLLPQQLLSVGTDIINEQTLYSQYILSSGNKRVINYNILMQKMSKIDLAGTTCVRRKNFSAFSAVLY